MSKILECFIKRYQGEGLDPFTTLSTFSMFMSSTYLSVYAADVKNADQYLLGGMATASVVLPLILSLPIGSL